MTAEAATKKVTKAKTSAEHPTYADMVAAAIAALKDRKGSSRQAILKYVCANYKVDPAKAGTHVRRALTAGIKKGSLKMAKESGKGAGCFKLAEKPKVEKKKPAKKPAAKKPAAKKPAAKKPAAKKPKAAKKPAAAKKPKAAKKPAAKKPAAKKPAAKKPKAAKK